MTTTTQSPWRSAEQVAADLGVETEYVRRQLKNGVLVGKKLGNRWRVHVDDVEAFMRGGDRVAPAAQHKDTKKSARQQRGGRATVGGG